MQNSKPKITAQASGKEIGTKSAVETRIGKIVFATDFSDCSRNAMEYAAWLADQFSAELHLFHSVGLPVGNSDMLVNPISMLEKIADDRLVKLENELREKYPAIGEKMDHDRRSGFPSENIVRQAAEQDADVLVVGSKGIRTGLHWLAGSTNGEVVRRAECPVLAVPADSKPAPIRNVVIAADLDKIPKKGLDYVSEIVRKFDAELSVLHVIPPREHFSPSAYEEFKLDFMSQCSLERVSFHLFETDQDSVVKAIQDYTGFENADLIVMTSRPRNLLARLFQRSETKWMTLETKVPLLILHEQPE